MASNSPLNRHARLLESYIAYEPPITEIVESAELGLTVEYEDRWADEIFTWFSSGRTLVSYCQQPQKPARSLVLSWLNQPDQKYDHLRDRYEKGLLNRAIALIDEVGDIAEEPLIVGPKGFLDPVSMADKKQRVDAKLRLAALLDPLKFSPLTKTAQSVALTQINLTKNNVIEMTDEQLLRVLSEMERKKTHGDTTTVDLGGTGGTGGQRALGPSERP